MNYYYLDYIDHKKGQTNQWKGKCDHQVKQNNGKENVIIRLNRTMERKNAFKHIIQGYILPKDKRSMISMTGYHVENSLGRGENFHDITNTAVFG